MSNVTTTDFTAPGSVTIVVDNNCSIYPLCCQLTVIEPPFDPRGPSCASDCLGLSEVLELPANIDHAPDLVVSKVIDHAFIPNTSCRITYTLSTDRWCVGQPLRLTIDLEMVTGNFASFIPIRVWFRDGLCGQGTISQPYDPDQSGHTDIWYVILNVAQQRWYEMTLPAIPSSPHCCGFTAFVECDGFESQTPFNLQVGYCCK